MDRVQHRPGVRLDRDPVVGPERMEIERGHDCGHRRAARLMTADLQPVGAFPDMVGMMDGPGAKPAQPVVDQLQGGDIGRGLLEHGPSPSAVPAAPKARKNGGPLARATRPVLVQSYSDRILRQDCLLYTSPS